MIGLKVDNSNEKLVFSIDKSAFTEEVLVRLMKIARAEYLVEKVAFDPAIEAWGKEMKQQWWEENKREIIQMS